MEVIQDKDNATGTMDPRSSNSRAPTVVKIKEPTLIITGQTGGVSEKLLSRANTMLRAATLSRSNTKTGSGTFQIKDTVQTLQREKTRLTVASRIEEEDDADMKAFLSKKKSEKEYNDSDFDTDLEDEAPPITPSHWSPSTLYKKTCKKLGIRPVPFVERSIESKEVKVLNRCLNSLDLLCITNALISNQTVTRLTLDGNDIGDEGAQLIAWLMKDQETFIEKLSIADNDIGPDGFQAISEMLMENRLINSLNISGNRAGDEQIKTMAAALKKNHSLQTLNLSFNSIGDKAAKYIASAIASNEGLSSLDLSWNKIRPTGGTAICHALKENVILKTLNLSMNGLSTPGSLFIGETLKKNETLTYLDITFNRIFDEGALHIAKGLEKNEKLHHLIMHHNPLTSLGAKALLTAISTNQNTAMWKLDISSVPVVKEVVSEYEEYCTVNDGFQLLHGLVLDSDQRIETDMAGFSAKNPMAMVKDYIEEEGLRLMDFFKLMDKDHGGSISREEFVEGLQQANVPMSTAQIDRLVEMLDKDGDGEIDYQEFVEGDKAYRRKRLKKKLAAIEAMRIAMKNPEKEESWMV